METVEILTKARELISDERRWTQGWFARDANGCKVRPSDPTATCFCVYGALYRSSLADIDEEGMESNPAINKARRLLMDVSGAQFPADVADFNDEHSHAEVLSLFDAAIAAAREA